MRKVVLACCLPLFFAMLGPGAASQEAKKTAEPAPASTEPAHYYRIDFLIQELDAGGKVVNARSYSATVSSDPKKPFDPTYIRTGSRIPVKSGSQFQYVDTGVNIDAHALHPMGHDLAMNLSADVSSIATPPESSESLPVIRQNKWQGAVLIPIGKSAIVFSSDLLDTKGTMQVVVTAKQLE